MHFPATKQSAERIRKLGEDTLRIHQVGSPGIDGIAQARGIARMRCWTQFPALQGRQFALLLLHPTDFKGKYEAGRAGLVLKAIRAAGVEHVVGIYPEQRSRLGRDCEGVGEAAGRFHISCSATCAATCSSRLLRECAVLVGNSSSGIIEAASFDTPVVNIGDRQRGRERGANVIDVAFDASAHPRRPPPCDRQTRSPDPREEHLRRERNRRRDRPHPRSHPVRTTRCSAKLIAY